MNRIFTYLCFIACIGITTSAFSVELIEAKPFKVERPAWAKNDQAWEQFEMINYVRANPFRYAQQLEQHIQKFNVGGNLGYFQKAIADMKTRPAARLLIPNQNLFYNSYNWSVSMSNRRVLVHSGQGYTENISMVSGALSIIMNYIVEHSNSYRNSQNSYLRIGHRINIMNPNHTYGGVGVYGQYSTQFFQ
jgi:uncharacterized protein YkwD